ncbi:MAG: hypothetical protein ACJA2S_000951 [Cyclobacteriaceae bacterium]|jgi:hypothetical protein
MNELVKRLAKEPHEVETSRPKKTIEALKECLTRDYVHVLFKETQTELGIKLDKSNCDFTNCDLDNGKGRLHLEGGVTLNYDHVRVKVDLELETLNGQGQLYPISEEEYNSFMN